MNQQLSLLLLLLLFPASQMVFANPQLCSSITSSQDVLKCVQENHPEVREANVQIEAAKLLEGVGAQRPNPELEGGFVRGSSLGDEILEREISFSQEIEIGGKRRARIGNARAKESLSKAIKSKTLEGVTIKTVLVLYRLRQAKEELEALSEALATFSRAKSQYRRRRSLSPENEDSLNVFELAEGHTKLQKQALLEEQRHLKAYITLVSGLDYGLISKYLPGHKKIWPKLATTKGAPGSKSADMLMAHSELKIANSDLELQKSESWPNLTVSPLYQYNSEGGIKYNAYGLGLSFPIPLWHANGAGRAHAYQQKRVAELSLRNKSLKLKNLREVEIEAYNTLVSAIGKTQSHKSVENRHRSVEKLFRRGLVSSPLIIEVHRQIIDFLKGTHEHETRALKALWTIYMIDGQILEKRL